MTPEEAADKLNPDALRSELERAMQQVVLVVEGNVKRVTPVRTGNLRRSITGRVEERGRRGVVGTNVVYARPVHRRTPYLERGLEASRDQIDAILAEAGETWAGSVAS